MFASFMINTWIVATIIAVVAGSVGFFVVLRGATFAAHALPLGTFPGAAAASLLGVNALWGLFVFALAGVIGIVRLGQRQRNDVATALTLIALLGFGTLCLSLSGHYAQGVYGLLFGQVIGVSAGDIPPVLAVSLLVVALICLCFRPLLLSSVSADLGAARGVSARGMDLLFLAILALATAMALPVVGALLVFSLMVGAGLRRAILHQPPRQGDGALRRHCLGDRLGRHRARVPLQLADRVFRRRLRGFGLCRSARMALGEPPDPCP